MKHQIARALSWVADLGRAMKRMWHRLFMVAAVVIVAGCTAGGGYEGTSRGIQGSLDLDWRGGQFKGVHTTSSEGETPMGYRDGLGGEDMYSTFEGPNGTGTGRAAQLLAYAVYLEKFAIACAVAPDAEICNGKSLP